MTATGAAAGTELEVREVYRQLASVPGDWVSITELRARLPHVPAEALTEVLRGMDRLEDAHLAPEPNQRLLTPADRAAAVVVGGMDNHLIKVDLTTSAPDTTRATAAAAGQGAAGQATAAPAAPQLLGAPMVAALEAAWAAIRARHPQVPAAVVVLASGTAGGGAPRLGHFGALRWQHAGADTAAGGLSEVMVSGEGLARGPVDVLGTLLHEAAHALADARGVQDTSRQGRWHNRRYAELAGELGLEVAQAPGIGWSTTTVPAGTAAAYAGVIDQLRAALTLYRRAEAGHGAGSAGGRKSSNNPLPCLCTCPRRIRVAPTVLEAGPIICGVCDQEFLPEADPPAGGEDEGSGR
jgi:hypothetical protein